ncbi:hypothetical protein [Candidatus Accumulibacter sp. ACC007]|uniref:hypothetical protein n=1 Tax=Candidatus Accumulibacter sp. ACC007 TaxID=2823333 RepID=UPI0025C65FE1|nr:hypothetical protein [Candidatus Accumulibacter sp. ACC007]
MSRSKFTQRALLLLSALAAGTACAAEIPVKILGPDDLSCRAWTESRADADERALYVAWIRGVLTGHNYALRSQQVSTMSGGTIEKHATRYCNDNPRGDLSDAAFRLSDKFSGRNAAITK